MEDKDRNKMVLWRRFERTEKQPVAKGDGYIGENDFKVSGSMWPSMKGKKKDGSPWQMWRVSFQPAQGETRKLIAVPSDLLPRVLALIESGSDADDTPSVPEPPEDIGPTQDDLPF